MGLLNEIPSNVARAFYGYHEWDIEAFASRWGGLHTEVFIRVLAEGQGDDKAFAIFAIGYLDTPWSREQMRSFLESPVRKERWASALSLGAGHDEHAIPYLEQILLEGLNPAEQPSPDEEDWYLVQRHNAARLLTSWGSATVVPVLRQSFLAVEALRECKPSSDDYLFDYQDTLAYALGQYGAVGALTGIALTTSQRRVAMNYLALGILRAKERYTTDIGLAMITNKNLQQEVAKVLEQQFGLTEHERQDTIKNFWKDHRRRIEEVRRSTEEDTDEYVSEAENDKLIA